MNLGYGAPSASIAGGAALERSSGRPELAWQHRRRAAAPRGLRRASETSGGVKGPGIRAASPWGRDSAALMDYRTGTARGGA